MDLTISGVNVLSSCDQSRCGYRFGYSRIHANFMFCSGQWGTMSQISVIFGMPLMILMVTEGPNRERNSDEQELLQELVSGLPPHSDNKAVALLLMYMGNHMETADEDFGTIPERWVMRLFFMLLSHACPSRSLQLTRNLNQIPFSGGICCCLP